MCVPTAPINISVTKLSPGCLTGFDGGFALCYLLTNNEYLVFNTALNYFVLGAFPGGFFNQPSPVSSITTQLYYRTAPSTWLPIQGDATTLLLTTMPALSLGFLYYNSTDGLYVKDAALTKRGIILSGGIPRIAGGITSFSGTNWEFKTGIDGLYYTNDTSSCEFSIRDQMAQKSALDASVFSSFKPEVCGLYTSPSPGQIYYFEDAGIPEACNAALNVPNIAGQDNKYKGQIDATCGGAGCSSKPVCANQTLTVNTNKTAIPPPTLSAASSSGGLSGGAIAGIVIGSIVGVALLVYILYTLLVKFGWWRHLQDRIKPLPHNKPVPTPEGKEGDFGVASVIIPSNVVTHLLGEDSKLLTKEELENFKLRGIDEKELSIDEKTIIALDMYNLYRGAQYTLKYENLDHYRSRDAKGQEIKSFFDDYVDKYSDDLAPVGNGIGTMFTSNAIEQVKKHLIELPPLQQEKILAGIENRFYIRSR